MATEHGHSVPKDWYLVNPRPKRFTKDNATFCKECGMVLAYKYRGMSYVSRDYWRELDRRAGVVNAGDNDE